MGARSGFKLRKVVEKFEGKYGIPHLRLECGHEKTDPMVHYGNELAKAFRRLALDMSGEPIKVRCYQCREVQPDGDRKDGAR